MPITLITGPASAGTQDAVLETVRGHLAQGENPLVVVPGGAQLQRTRRGLAREGAVMGVRVERFEGLIGEAARRSGTSAPALPALARERLVTAILEREPHSAERGPHRAERGPDGAERGHRDAERGPHRAERSPWPAPTAGLVRALIEFLGELQLARTGPARLSRALSDWSAQDGGEVRARALARLFAEYLRVLDEIGRLDDQQRAARTLDALRRHPSLWGSTPVLIVGFERLGRLHLDAIETLGAVVDASVTVSLSYEPGRAAFAPGAAAFQTLAPRAREHRALSARSSAPGRALAHLERSLFEPRAPRRPPEAAVRLLEGAGERAELEQVGREIVALIATGVAPGETVLLTRARGAGAELLEGVLAEAGIPFAWRRPRRFADTGLGRALLGLLRSAAPAGRQDDAGRGDLGDLLAWLRAPGLLKRPELADDLEARARRSGALSASQARALWEQEQWPLDAIDQLREASARGAPTLLERAERELVRLFTAPRRGLAAVLLGEEREDTLALAAGTRALGELRELARSARQLAPSDAADLARTLEGVTLLVGERQSQSRIAVLAPENLTQLESEPKALFMCGLQQGVLPASLRRRTFLSAEERRRLAETSGLRLGESEDPLAAEQAVFYQAACCPSQLLVLSWHAASDDGLPTPRSPFVDAVCALFDESLAVEQAARSHAAQAVAPSTPTAALGERAWGLSKLRAPKVLEELAGHTWSASSLEIWISCPVRWAVERMLRGDAIDPAPEPLTRGSLVHDVLKDVLVGLGERTGSARLIPGSLALALELMATSLDEREPSVLLSALPERREPARRRLRADLEVYLRHACRQESQLEPTYFELDFGFAQEGGDGLPALDLGGGVMLRGRIDRIDVSKEGLAVVYDYKGRNVLPAAKWRARGNLQVALYMRAAQELLGMRAVGGFYQPVGSTDLRARGVLDGDAGVQLGCVSSDLRESSQVRELLRAAGEAARHAAGEAARGELQARPQTCAFGGGCAYPTLCPCGRA